ncbi:MAG: GNAT family N-acetyltransferase [Abitibacteriaceae bacterium]|nr:GNAT family N-acetyltransferase [Abditibacteriaceae bacterium]MBV9865551.1 GNAT family N-acetyltransferase [Abditibacteriaceae bacterium]
MREEEAEAVLALWNEAAEYSLKDEGAANILRHLRQCASHADVFCLVGEEAGTLVGFLTASAIVHPSWRWRMGEIEELYVSPTVRRHGLGTLLVEHAVIELLQQGVARIDAKVEYEAPQALAFWRSVGWKNIFTTFTFYEGMSGETNV